LLSEVDLDLNLIINEIDIHGKPQHKIKRVTVFKYLVLYIDEDLTFKYHFNTISKNVSRRILNLSRFKRCINAKSLKTIFTAIVNPTIEYALPIYAQHNIDFGNIQFKIVTFLNYYCNSNDIHKDLEIATATQLLHFHTVVLTRTILNSSSVKNYIKNLFMIKERQRASKFANNIMLPKYNKLMYVNSFQYRAIQCWNSLPSDIKATKPIDEFKELLKKYLGMIIA